MKILDAIIPDFRKKAFLVGLLSDKLIIEEYFKREENGHVYSVCRRVLPTNYARLDVIYWDGTPVGSIVCCELDHDLYHMVGMYVDEQFRSSNIKCAGGSVKVESPAKVLLKAFVGDMVTKKKQVSLEVLNSNEPAWNLYEKILRDDSETAVYQGFRLMTKVEIEQYAKSRNKKIGEWHEIKTRTGIEMLGVQWKHVPSFGGSSVWSINRLYLLKPDAERFNLRSELSCQIRAKMKTFFSIAVYGSIWAYLFG